MEIQNLFKNFAIDSWYKAVLYIGAVLLVVSFFVDVRGISNGQLQLLAAGAFLIGLGEWKNHKVASWFKPPFVYTGPPALMSTKIRQPDAFGILLDVAGAILLSLAIWSLIRN